MEFKTLKKSHKIQIIIGALVVCVIGGALTFATTRAKYRVTQDIKLVNGTVNYTPYDYRIAYININSTTYTCSTAKCSEMLSYIPNSSSYTLTSSSYCETKNESGTYEKDSSITLTHQNNTITTNLKQKKAKCYLYFADSEKPTISNVSTTVTESTIKVTVSASDNVGVTEYCYQIGTESVSCLTSATKTFSGLSAGTTYSIKVYVKDAAGNQSTTTTKSVTTSSPSPSYITLAKLNINPKTTTPDFTQTATTNEGVYRVADGMYGGYSYYWRGAVTNNYVSFANKCWRIVRINGDGTIRLIYDGTSCHANGTSTTDSIAVASQAYNKKGDNSSYVGWTYTLSSQRPTNNTTATASNAKTQTESWFSTNITGANAEKVADGKFCNDRSVGRGTYSATGSQFNYGAYTRTVTNRQPTLDCQSGDVYTLKVGLITIDESSYAGGVYGITNQSYYLYNGQDYWTMSPGIWGGPVVYACGLRVDSNGKFANMFLASTYGIRPVINLKSDTTFSSGDGTRSNPYVVS